MSSVSTSFLKASVSFLNQPLVKEGVKNIASTVTFGFGLLQVYDVLCGREISTMSSSTDPKWVQVANKIVIVCAKISLILSATVSRPGVFLLSSLSGIVFSQGQLNRAFGANTIFAVNPWHPRHLVSLAAVILALPSVMQSTYRGFQWVCKTIQKNEVSTGSWLTDSKIRLMALFNTVTSRPVLHIGNQLGRALF